MPLPEYAISPPVASALGACISTARLRPYQADCSRSPGEARSVAAIRLYRWNAHMAGALILPIHLCEVAVRGAAAEALNAVYGPTWPIDENFRFSLRSNSRAAAARNRTGGPRYSASNDLESTATKFARSGVNTWSAHQTEQVVADLNLVFWVKLFASNHDQRLWLPHLLSVFPHLPTKDAPQWRKDISQRIDQLRLLRNLVAHHEPVYSRALDDDITSIRTLIGYRSEHLLEWYSAIETASEILKVRPALRAERRPA